MQLEEAGPGEAGGASPEGQDSVRADALRMVAKMGLEGRQEVMCGALTGGG